MEINISIGERLKEEREALGKTQGDFASIAELAGVPGATRQSQAKYEKGLAAPSAAYLSAMASAGVDVRYVLTGDREFEPAPPLTAEEQVLLQYFRKAVPAVRTAALGALMGAPAITQIGGTNSQHSSGDGAMMIGSINNGKKRK
ncbi:MAG: helix-turn-helix transcriptional regulator [Comamonas sp.]